MILGWVLTIAAVAVAVSVICLVKRLNRLQIMVHEGWNGINAQLKRRADLVPHLIATVEGHMGHAPELPKTVTELLSQSMQTIEPAQRQAVENALTGGLARLFAVVDRYPEIMADQDFQVLQRRLGEIESQIQLARRYYNGTARQFNTAIKKFPFNLIARWLAFEPAMFFEFLQPADEGLPQVRL